VDRTWEYGSADAFDPPPARAVVAAGAQILIAEPVPLGMPHFVIQRRMLLEIEARAEAGSAPQPSEA
jgi:hypothetical protein